MQIKARYIEESALRSADLARQLLVFARKQTVAGMLKMLLRLMVEDIDLVWMPKAGLWPVKIDPSQIDQLLASVCIKARDSIAGVGKATIETENTVFNEAYCADHSGFICVEYVMLDVSDDGRISEFFETRFVRLEYAGNREFNVAYMRHTGQWWEILQGLTLEECFDEIRQ
jgi:hypothetical protein